MQLRTPADSTELQILANAVGQIQAEAVNAEGALREVRKEMDFLKDENATERLAQTKLAVAHRAVKLASLMPRLQAVLTEIESVAGAEAVARASMPVKFER